MSKMYEALKKAQEQGIPVEVPEPVTADAQAPVEIPFPETAHPETAYEETGYEENRFHKPVVPHLSGFARGERPTAVREKPSRDGIRHLPIQAAGKAAVIPWGAGDIPGGEQYRIIRTRLVQHPERPKLILVSSSGSGDGKTVSSINIAGVLSLRDNANVLLIDGDFRRSSVSAALGLPQGPGLSNVLSRNCTLQDALIRVEQFPNLFVLTAGTGGANPSELLDSEHWKMLCASVREHFDFVILDAPPVAAVADYELMQSVCDGVIFVIRPDHSDRTLVSKAFELIPEKQRLGVVLNCASKWFLWKTHESNYYYSAGQR